MRATNHNDGAMADARRLSDKACFAMWEIMGDDVGMEKMRKIESAVMQQVHHETKRRWADEKVYRERVENRVTELHRALTAIMEEVPRGSKLYEMAYSAINSESFIMPDGYLVHLDKLTRLS